LQREGDITAALSHPGIVRCLDCRDSGKGPFLIYELIPGARPWSETLLSSSLEERLEVVAQVLAAMEYAHRKTVVHRDLKPENVLLDVDGVARVADFGLVWTEEALSLTDSGALLGTPQYMAPEQIRGEQAARSPAVDVWALGVILYQCLTGEVPFQGSTLAELSGRICEANYTPVESLAPRTPPPLVELVRRCLRPDPSERIRDAGELRQAFLVARASGRASTLTLIVMALVVALGIVALARLAPSGEAAPSPAPSRPVEAPR
jgi:serine/threonine-protein kinase